MNYEQKGIFKTLKEFGLALMSNWVFQQIVYYLFPFAISCVLESSKDKIPFGPATFYSYPQVLYFSGYILVLVGFSAANKHILNQNKNSVLNRAVLDELVNNISSMTRYMVTLENDEKEEVFASLSQFVCNSLYTVFSNRFTDRDFCFSVIKQFVSNEKFMYTVPGYKSADLSSGDNRPRLVSSCEKYLKSILLTSVEKITIFDKNSIQKKMSNSTEKLEEYMAIPHKGDFDNICFVLQVECTRAGSFGRNKTEMERNVHIYIDPFIKLLENAYVQERMNLIYRGVDRIET